MLTDNKQKFALITGASRGIGAAIALQLAQDGFDIFMTYRNNLVKADQIASRIRLLGRHVWIIKADITWQVDRQKIFRIVSQHTSHLDLLVNNAGFDFPILIENYPLSKVESVINIILTSKISLTQLSLKYLKKSLYPSIINITSRLGQAKTIATVGAYAPAQAGVIKFTQCCALEFAKYHIRCNAIAAGLTDTDLNRDILTKKDWQVAAKNNPTGRYGQPQDVANVASFLASSKANYINGETILVDGGGSLV